VTTLNLQLSLAQRGFLIPRTTDNLEAYDDELRGTEYLLSETKDGNAQARQMFEKAIALDPKYALAYYGLGINYLFGWDHALSAEPNALERALQLEQQAIALDDSLSEAHSDLAMIYFFEGQLNQAVTEAQRGVTLHPNSAFGYFALANAMNLIWRPAEALAAVEKGVRLDPRNADSYLLEQGWAYAELGRYEESIPAFKRYLALTNHLWAAVILVQDYAELGQEDAAEAEAAEVERRSALNPNSPFGYFALASVMNNTGRPAEALAAAEKGMRLDPEHRDNYLGPEGRSYRSLGRYEDSIKACRGFLAHLPNLFMHLNLVADYVELGQDEAARAEAAEVLKLNPQFSVERYIRTVGPKGKVLADNLRWAADLHKAGLK